MRKEFSMNIETKWRRNRVFYLFALKLKKISFILVIQIQIKNNNFVQNFDICFFCLLIYFTQTIYKAFFFFNNLNILLRILFYIILY